MSISELPELSNSFDKKSSSQIGAGKRYAVSGLSGCGKTTMKRTRRIVMLLCSALIFTLILSACGNSSYNDRNLILSNEDSYTYKKCVDTGSTDTSLKREFQGFNGKDTIWMLNAAEDTSISIDLSGDDTQSTSVDLKKGTVRIILVEDGTSGSCEITLSDINNVSVDSPSGGLDSEEWMNDFFDDWM